MTRTTLKISLITLASMLLLPQAKASLADDVLGELATMRSLYRAEYAPAAWKLKYAGYDLNKSYAEAVAAVQANPNLTAVEAREILKNFVYAMKDYHTSISFVGTEAASLPFVVKSAGEKVYIAYIARDQLPEVSFPFHFGDELVTFAGISANDAIAAVQKETPANVPETDRALAELALTRRSVARGNAVPNGPITLGIRAHGSEKVQEIELTWKYTPEQIQPSSSMFEGRLADSSIFHPHMDVANVDFLAQDNPFAIGARSTFMPALGAKIWESSADSFFDAYIYKSTSGKLVGYIRIASYVAPDFNKAVSEFAAVISRFQSVTDAMVIDQVNNPGGAILYLYSLASMLTDQPLKTPLHQMAINQSDVRDALKMIDTLKDVTDNDKAVKAFAADDLQGYPASYELAQFNLNFAHFIVSEWNAGRKLTQPYYVGGVDHINPAAIHYSKPILLLTNHLDFSGGDFFPTILQDNKRVTVMGARTAGAGGYVNDIKISNDLGVDSFRCTESIAHRIDGNPIENLGVTPDISYEMTGEDYTGNFAPYVTAVRTAIDALK